MTRVEWIVVGIAAMILLAVGFLMTGGDSRTTELARRNACLDNLRLICRPFICTTGLDPQSIVATDWKDPKEVFRMLNGGTIPVCPLKGEYVFKFVDGGLYASCSFHGDLVKECGDPDEPHPLPLEKSR